MKVRIEIDTWTFVRFWLVVIGFGAAILALYGARTALLMIGIALFLALALNRPVTRLARHLPGKSRTLSTAIAFVAVVAAVSAVLFLVVPPVIEQTTKLIQSAPAMVRTVSEQWQGIGDLVDRYNIQPQIDQAVISLQENADKFVADIGKNVISGVSSVFSLFAAGLIVLVMVFLMLIEGPQWMDRLWGVYRDSDRMKRHKRLLNRMYGVFSGYVSGQLTVSGIGSVLAGLTVFVLSMFFSEVPANLALPTIAIVFTMSLIPMFGATIGGTIVAVLLGANSLIAGIIFAAYFIIYQQIENNYVVPAIQSKSLELSPLAVLIAVTVGLYMFGVLGGIISIPIAGCLKVLIEDRLDRSRVLRKESDKPLAKLARKIQGE